MEKLTISKKEYYCPVCGNKEFHDTNHTGEIYCICKNCGSCGLYCITSSERESDEKCQIIFYRFNVENKSDADAYKQLTLYLREKQYKKFSSFISYSALEALKRHDLECIELYNIHQFNNQIVSSIGRVFYWREVVFPNKKIKAGYYLKF